MKTHQIAPILTIILFLPILALQVNAGAIQSNTAIFNVTITESGGGSFNLASGNYSLIIGEPVVGNVTTGTSQFKFGFFHASKELSGFAVVINQPPNLPVWIFPNNGTVIVDTQQILLAYSSSDPDNDPITYIVYKNDTYLLESNTNSTTKLENGTYIFNVAAYDGSKYSGNASVLFTVDAPEGIDLTDVLIGLIPMFVSALLMAGAFVVNDEEHKFLKNALMLFSYLMIIPVLQFGFVLNSSTFDGALTSFLWIVIFILFFLIMYQGYYLFVKIMASIAKNKSDLELKY